MTDIVAITLNSLATIINITAFILAIKRDRLIVAWICLCCSLVSSAIVFANLARADEPRTYTCTGQNGLVVKMTEQVGCAPERDVPRAVRAIVTRGYEQDKKRGYITDREMRREIRAELKTYRCGWE